MTTLMMFDSDYSPEGVTRRLREELARNKLSESEAARQYGVPQQWVNRRMTGLTPWKVGELADFCRSLSLTYAYVVAGTRPIPPEPPGGASAVPAAVTSLAAHRERSSVPRPNTTSDEHEVDDDAACYVRLAEEDKSLTCRLTAECSAELSYRGLTVIDFTARRRQAAAVCDEPTAA